MRRVFLSFGFVCATTLMPVQAAPAFINGLTIPGNSLDASGGTTVNNGRLGFFSDLYYDPNRQEYWGVSDRGPVGSTIPYNTRVNRFTLNVNPVSGEISAFNVVETILFREGSSNFNGLAPNPSNALGFSFDPEGFVVLGHSGNFLVSDEYAPRLNEFARNGEFIRQYEVPANAVPKVGAEVNYTATTSDAPNLTAGRENNRGLEGLAISPDGQYAYAILQNGLITDGTYTAPNAFSRSLYTRILKYDTTTGLNVAQYAYMLDSADPGRSISALVALDDTRFLVLERNNRGVGVPNANLETPWDKKVYLIDLIGATDVTGVALNSVNPPGITPVNKTAAALIDLAANTDAASLAVLGGKAPEKWEGLTVGPQLDDGSYVLLAGTDNDYSVTKNGSNVQFDVYYDPTTGARAQCDLDATTNCVVIDPNGSVTTTPVTLTANDALIPGVLQAYKATSKDLGGYTAPVPGPLPVFGAAAALAWSRRLRQRIRRRA
jgi:hypothetical protein